MENLRIKRQGEEMEPNYKREEMNQEEKKWDGGNGRVKKR